MDHEITVPEVSDGVTSGLVIAISVAVGEQVEEDQTLLELETDKAVVAIPSPVAGKITAIKVAEGDQVPIGAVIMLVAAAAEAAETSESAETTETTEAAESTETTESAEPAESTEAPAVAAEPPPSDSVPAPLKQPLPPPVYSAPAEQAVDLSGVRRDDQVAPAAPSVRRLARELGVDIYQVQGSGSAGRISAEDIRLFVRDTMQRLTGGGQTPVARGEFTGLHAQRPLPDFNKWGATSSEPLSKIRQLTADAMAYAWSTVPMVTQYDQAGVEDLEEFRQDFNARVDAADKLTMTAILVKVCAAALRAFPQFNSSLDLASNQLILKHYQHIGVAVDTPSGLLVPVLRDAGDKGIEQLASELNALADKTRQRKISPAEMEGGSFTISNLGGIGGSAFTPIVYAPQVAILGVSQAQMQPVWNGTDFAPRLVLPLSLSYDHRVIDGADGARFLRWICQALEQPLHLVMKG